MERGETRAKKCGDERRKCGKNDVSLEKNTWSYTFCLERQVTVGENPSFRQRTHVQKARIVYPQGIISHRETLSWLWKGAGVSSLCLEVQFEGGGVFHLHLNLDTSAEDR